MSDHTINQPQATTPGVDESDILPAQPGPRRHRYVKAVGWWLSFAVCAFYGLFAVSLGVAEVLSWTGAVTDVRPRAVPLVFAVHAVTGGVALVAGPSQFNKRLRARHRRRHRVIGRIYVASVWIASLAGIWIAARFDVSVAVKAVFVVAALLWFTTTSIAYRHAVSRRIAKHREWMIRSFALSLFFAAFELWRAALDNSGLPASVAYPLGVFLGWFINLLIAEWHLRRTRHAGAQ